MQGILSEYYKYIIVGFIVTGFDFIILASLTEWLHVFYLLAACVAYIFASILQYYLSINYVFNAGTLKNKTTEFLVFFGLGALGLVLFEVFLYLFTNNLGMHYLIAKIFVTGIMFTFNFFSRKLVLFH